MFSFEPLSPAHILLWLRLSTDPAPIGCTLINKGSAPQKDGTLKECDIPDGVATEPETTGKTEREPDNTESTEARRGRPAGSRRGISWAA